jgi:hypothetical protein
MRNQLHSGSTRRVVQARFFDKKTEVDPQEPALAVPFSIENL